MAPDAVHYRHLMTRSMKWQGFWCLVALPTGATIGYLTAPRHERGWGLALVLVAAAVFALASWSSTWLEPADGFIVTRYWRRYGRRHRLAPEAHVRLRTYFILPGPYVILRVRPAGSRRLGGSICLLRNTDDQWAGIDAARIRLLADTLQWHCPDAAPDVITILHAHADHLDAGLPVDDSPLGRMLGGGRP